MGFREFKQLIQAGDIDRVRAALDADPDLLNARDVAEENWETRTALHCAAKFGHLEIARLLVERGAEVYSHPSNSYPAVLVAAESQRSESSAIIDYFLHEIPHKAEGTLGTGATIHIAARLGWQTIVQQHLDLDPLAIHQRGWHGETPLHLACQHGQLDVVRALLDAGADLEAEALGGNGGRPLHGASMRHPDVVRLLLERGAEVDAIISLGTSSYHGLTPLLLNASQSDDCQQVAELLLQFGADPQRQVAEQNAYEIASQRGNHKIAEVLQRNRREGEKVERCILLRRPPALPPRPDDAHKGTFGRACIIAGSRGMSGAACLAGQAALHAGAGLVTVATPECVSDIVASSHPSFMTVPLPDKDGKASIRDVATLLGRLDKMDAVAIGPGLGQGESVRELVQRVYRDLEKPLVVDADGLNALAFDRALLSQRCGQAARVLTPHPGEFSRLTGEKIEIIQRQRQALAVDFARQHQVVLVLKGPHTIVTDGRRLAINPTGGSALATGGTGDVLTGVIAALLAQGMEAFEAAQLATYIHGLAGEICAEQHSLPFVTSCEVLKCLDAAWQRESGRR